MTARLICCALLGGLAFGCATSNDTAQEPRVAEAPSNPGQAEARAILLEGDLEPAQLGQLAKHLEGLAEVHSVEIQLEESDEGPTRARLTLGGLDMPSSTELEAAVAEFDGLGDVTISVEEAPVDHGPVDQAGIAEVAHSDKSPEEVKAEVIDKLRADGVEGDIQVDVIDDENGERRVEVKVSQHEERTE